MSKIYKIIIFTASLKEYADLVINSIDPDKKLISGRFYRDDMTKIKDRYFIKDLGVVKKDLSKVLIIDNVCENFEKQPDNGIFIKSWYDDEEDTDLRDLIPFLKKIVRDQVEDVRVFLKEFRDDLIENIKKGGINLKISQ